MTDALGSYQSGRYLVEGDDATLGLVCGAVDRDLADDWSVIAKCLKFLPDDG